jgi:hypothetical protein
MKEAFEALAEIYHWQEAAKDLPESPPSNVHFIGTSALQKLERQPFVRRER